MHKNLLFIPCYNCEEEIVKVLQSLNSPVGKYFNEILVLDNGSMDNTRNNAIEFAKRNPQMPIKVCQNCENYNLGGSHKVAFEYALKNDFEYLVVLHGDNQGDINDIAKILETKEYENYECFLGARFMKGSKLVNYSFVRILGNIAFNILFSITLFHKFYDLGGGLNIYSTKMLKSKFYHKFPDALTFNYLMTMALDFYKTKYKFFPLTWKEEGQVSNVKVTSQAFDLLAKFFTYLVNKEKFITSELRTNIVDEYKTNCLHSNIC